MSRELSYISNPKKTYTRNTYKTVIDLLQEEVLLNPDRECMIHRGLDGYRESITYKHFNSKATFLAKVLVSKGVNKGDKIALLGPNTLEKAIAETGIIMAGSVVVHLTMNLTNAKDVSEIFTLASCRFLLVDPGRDQTDVEGMCRLVDAFSQKQRSPEETSDLGILHVLFLRSVGNIPSNLDISGIRSLYRTIDLPKLFPEDDAWIFTTSGSTGNPKMVCHSHFSMIGNETDFFYRGNPKDASMIAFNNLPFGWLAGCIWFQIIHRYVRVFADSSIGMTSSSTLDIWNVIKEEKCTHAFLMPHFLSDLIEIKDGYADPFKLDLIATGGQIIDKYLTQVMDVFTEAMTICYGSTEVNFVAFNLILKKGDGVVLGDVGYPVEGMEIKIVDQNGNLRMRGENGEICIRSNRIFHGYYEDEHLTKKSFFDGNWFRMGDTGYITKNGHICIQGRIKDVISRGTKKIMPAAVEEIILKMEGIVNVVVVSVPDQRLYEEVCVCFTVGKEKKIEETDVQDFCEKQFKIENSADGLGVRPTYYLKMECLPKLPSGKFDKTKVRTEAINRLGILTTLDGKDL